MALMESKRLGMKGGGLFGSTAFFEFTTAAAGAGVITTNFGSFAAGCGRRVHAGRKTGAGRWYLLGAGWLAASGEGGGGRGHLHTGEGGEEILHGIDGGGGAEEAGGDLFVDAFHEIHEEVVGFAFVFDEGVALSVGA